MNQTGKCRHCGSPLYEGMKFCGNCGRPAEQSGQQMQQSDRQSSQPGQMRQPQRQNGQSQQTQQSRRQSSQSEQMPQRQNGQFTRTQQGSSRNPETDNRSYDPNTYENRVRRQRPANDERGYRQTAEHRYNEQNPKQDRQQYENAQILRNQQAAQQKQRYRQEELERDWQQSWDRAGEEEEDGGFTPIQYVLIGIAVILLMALVGFGVYWILGKSTGNTGRRQEQNQIASDSMQTDALQAESLADILILDDTQDKETEAVKQTEVIQIQTGSETESETEEPVTEKQTETEPPREASVLQYPEFTVTIPGTWWGKYGIEENSGSYTFYQQAARDAGYGGILFIISRYTDMSYETLPNYEVIGTGGGAALVYRLSNDLQYPKENAAIAAEYQAMANDVAGIRAGIRVLISGEGPRETEPVPDIQIFSEDYYVIEEPQADQQEEVPVEEILVENTQNTGQSYAGGYIPESSSRALNDSDVAGMSYDDMQMAINEIYARHGRIFQKDSIAEYFNGQAWYNGTVSAENFDESVFSSVESQNIQFLLEKMGN